MIGVAPTMPMLASLLRGDRVPWRAFGLASDAFLRACDDAGLTGLVSERVRSLPVQCEWPHHIREALFRDVRARTATELVHRAEILSVLENLAAAGIDPILLKGAALAYSVYPTPASRPRIDTDLLIRRDQVDRARRAMAGAGYMSPAYCSGEFLFCQFPLEKTDRFGLVHTLDFHWKISTQPVFAGMLTFDDVTDRTLPVPALGPHARTLAAADALLLACVHPVMHHRNAASLLWMHDIHLLASSLPVREFVRFADLAIGRQVSVICARQLESAKESLGTPVPETVVAALRGVPRREPSAAYLRPNRRWIDELLSSFVALPRWRDRARLLREVVLPSPGYMLKTHGLSWSFTGASLLPVLYLRRLSSGGWRALAGRK